MSCEQNDLFNKDVGSIFKKFQDRIGDEEHLVPFQAMKKINKDSIWKVRQKTYCSWFTVHVSESFYGVVIVLLVSFFSNIEFLLNLQEFRPAFNKFKKKEQNHQFQEIIKLGTIKRKEK